MLGRTVIHIDREYEDRPDIALKLDGVITGCECVQIPSEDVYKWVRTKFKHLAVQSPSVVEVVWPHEPHSWVEEAILAKRNKIFAFKKNVSAEKMFLLIHAPIGEKQEFINSKAYFVKELMQLAASSTIHQFDETYFFDEEAGMLKLYPNEFENQKFQFDFSSGYPVSSFVIGVGSFTTMESEGERKLYDSGPLEPQRIHVRPKDPEFRKHKARITNNQYKLVVDAESTDANLRIETVVQR